MTESNIPEISEDFEPRQTPELKFKEGEEITLIPLKRFYEVGVEDQFCELACKVSRFSHDFPESYADFLVSKASVFPDSEENIFNLPEDFPQKFESNESDSEFDTDMLIIDVEHAIIENNIDYGHEAIIGLAVNAPNGTSFVFYIHQIKAIEDYIIGMKASGALGV